MEGVIPRPRSHQLVLDALRDGPLSSFELADRLRLGLHRLFPALSRLERDGEITSTWAQGDVPRRRIYRLAEATTSG